MKGIPYDVPDILSIDRGAEGGHQDDADIELGAILDGALLGWKERLPAQLAVDFIIRAIEL